jgi:hypothetical protein
MIFYKYKTDKVVEYYHKEEADEMGIQYVPWRDAQSAGQWILTDDDFVLQTIRVTHIAELQKGGITPRHRRRIVTELAIRYPHGRAEMNIAEHMKTRRYGIIPRSWWQDFKVRNPAINTGLIRLILSGQLPLERKKKYTVEQINAMQELAEKICYDKRVTGHYVMLYYNINEVRMELQEQIVKAVGDRGWKIETVLDLIEKAKTSAEASNKVKDLCMVIDRMAPLVGMSKVIANNTPSQLPQVDTDPLSDTSFEDGILDRNRKVENA